jgi:hypothetical protein
VLSGSVTLGALRPRLCSPSSVSRRHLQCPLLPSFSTSPKMRSPCCTDDPCVRHIAMPQAQSSPPPSTWHHHFHSRRSGQLTCPKARAARSSISYPCNPLWIVPLSISFVSSLLLLSSSSACNRYHSISRLILKIVLPDIYSSSSEQFHRLLSFPPSLPLLCTFSLRTTLIPRDNNYNVHVEHA